MLKKKIKKIIIGTNNRGKLKEIRDLLPKSIKTYSTLDFKLKSPIENGKTFEENSLIKSKYFSKKTNLIIFPGNFLPHIGGLESHVDNFVK